MLDEVAKRLLCVVLNVEREDREATYIKRLLALDISDHRIVFDAQGFCCAFGAVERYPPAGDPAHLSGVVSVLMREETPRETLDIIVQCS